MVDISIHALRKESDPERAWLNVGQFISIHALRKESDANHAANVTGDSDFNPRSP